MSIFSLTYQKAMMVRLNNWIVSKKLEMHMKEESQTKCKFFLKLVAGARLQSPQTPKDISLASFFIKCSFLSPLWPTWNTTIFFKIEMLVYKFLYGVNSLPGRKVDTGEKGLQKKRWIHYWILVQDIEWKERATRKSIIFTQSSSGISDGMPAYNFPKMAILFKFVVKVLVFKMVHMHVKYWVI